MRGGGRARDRRQQDHQEARRGGGDRCDVEAGAREPERRLGVVADGRDAVDHREHRAHGLFLVDPERTGQREVRGGQVRCEPHRRPRAFDRRCLARAANQCTRRGVEVPGSHLERGASGALDARLEALGRKPPCAFDGRHLRAGARHVRRRRERCLEGRVRVVRRGQRCLFGARGPGEQDVHREDSQDPPAPPTPVLANPHGSPATCRSANRIGASAGRLEGLRPGAQERSIPEGSSRQPATARLCSRAFQSGELVANHKSAKKRARQDLKRRARNRHISSGVKSAVKALRQASPEESEAALRKAESVIRRASSKGVLSKKQASRRVSRLAKAANTPA